jgi:hypothetical protein
MVPCGYASAHGELATVLGSKVGSGNSSNGVHCPNRLGDLPLLRQPLQLRNAGGFDVDRTLWGPPFISRSVT